MGVDNKAKNAIILLQELKNLTYCESLKYALEHYCNGSADCFLEIIVKSGCWQELNRQQNS